jgi:hypothetical protein
MSGESERQPFLLAFGEGPSVCRLAAGSRRRSAAWQPRIASRLSRRVQSIEPQLDVYYREDEAWYVLDGQMTFYIGDKVLESHLRLVSSSCRAGFRTRLRWMSSRRGSWSSLARRVRAVRTRAGDRRRRALRSSGGDGASRRTLRH